MAIENTVLHLVASFANVPDKIVSDIEKEMPALARLCRAARLLNPVVSEATPTIKKIAPKLMAIWNAPVRETPAMIGDVAPLIDQLKPYIQQAIVIAGSEQQDFIDVTPVLLEVADFINTKFSTPGNTLGGGTE